MLSKKENGEISKMKFFVVKIVTTDLRTQKAGRENYVKNVLKWPKKDWLLK